MSKQASSTKNILELALEALEYHERMDEEVRYDDCPTRQAIAALKRAIEDGTTEAIAGTDTFKQAASTTVQPSFDELQRWALTNGHTGDTDDEALKAYRQQPKPYVCKSCWADGYTTPCAYPGEDKHGGIQGIKQQGEPRAWFVETNGVPSSRRILLHKNEAAVYMKHPETHIVTPLYTSAPAIPTRPEGCMWAVTKGGRSICQPPKSFYAKEPTIPEGHIQIPVNRYRELIDCLHDMATGKGDWDWESVFQEHMEMLAASPEYKDV
jgi:hypothetical protein